MPSLEARIRTAALAFSPLATLLGYDGLDPSSMRWYDTQLRPGKVFPALVLTLVSDPETYTFNRRLATSFARIQFDIWDHDPENSFTVQEQLAAFLDQLNLYGVTGLVQNANQIVGKRKVNFPDRNPPEWQRIVDALIFNNDLTT